LTSKLPSTRLDISRHESLVNLRYLTEAVLHTVACHTNDLNTWFEVKDEGSWRFFEKLLPKKFSMTDFRVTAVTAEYEQETGVGVSKVCRRMPTLVFCSHLFWLVSLCLSVHMFKWSDTVLPTHTALLILLHILLDIYSIKIEDR
jgi:hypothetical protein